MSFDFLIFRRRGRTVFLMSDQRPAYPTRCVLCGLDPPAGRSAPSAWTWTRSIFTPSRFVLVSPPACARCVLAHRTKRILQLLSVMIVTVGAGVAVRAAGDPLPRWLFSAVAAVGASALWSLVAPARFHVAGGPILDSIAYTFRSEHDAIAFEALNPGST